MRFGLHLVAIGAVGGIVFACIPDPHGDYDDFLERTAGLTPDNTTPEAGPIDAKPPEQAVEQLYVAVCVISLANRDPGQAFRFWTESKYVPDGPGAPTGKLTLTLTTLKGWDHSKNPPTGQYYEPPVFTSAEKLGNPIVITETPVSDKGRFTANLGKVAVVGAANPISGKDAVIDGVILDGLFGTDNFCSSFGGTLIEPYVADLPADKNTCLWTKVKDGDPFPKITKDKFVCPF